VRALNKVTVPFLDMPSRRLPGSPGNGVIFPAALILPVEDVGRSTPPAPCDGAQPRALSARRRPRFGRRIALCRGPIAPSARFLAQLPDGNAYTRAECGRMRCSTT